MLPTGIFDVGLLKLDSVDNKMITWLTEVTIKSSEKNKQQRQLICVLGQHKPYALPLIFSSKARRLWSNLTKSNINFNQQFFSFCMDRQTDRQTDRGR